MTIMKSKKMKKFIKGTVCYNYTATNNFIMLECFPTNLKCYGQRSKEGKLPLEYSN